MLEKTTKWAKINIQPVERLDECFQLLKSQ